MQKFSTAYLSKAYPSNENFRIAFLAPSMDTISSPRHFSIAI